VVSPGGRSPPQHVSSLLVMMSTLVGALVLARSVEDPALAMRILEVVRERLKTQVSTREKAGQ